MSFGQDTGGAVLSFVTRLVKGEVLMEKTRFNMDTMKNEKEVAPIEEPVIVFFPHGNVQVFSYKAAEKLGYLETPQILNFEAVDKPDTIAGKFKFAMSDDQRQTYWLQLEQHVISSCLANGGYPLPRTAQFSEQSIVFAPTKRKTAA